MPASRAASRNWRLLAPRRPPPTDWRRKLLRGNRGGAVGLDLLDRRDDGIKGEHGRSVAGLVVAHRLEHGDVPPFAARRLTAFLQHSTYGFAQIAQFGGVGADDVACHD